MLQSRYADVRGGATWAPAPCAAGAAAPDAALAQALYHQKYDAAMQLTAGFAKYFNRRPRPEPVYKPTPDGFMVRQSRRLRYPCNVGVRTPRLKSWSVQDLREGDLLHFAVGFNELSGGAVATAQQQAQRHLNFIKRAYLTTPQEARGRRWFLFDMLNHVMPATRRRLDDLARLLRRHGEENVKFAILMFREQEIGAGERCVDPGNLCDIVDQVQYYFSREAGGLAGVTTAHIRGLDARMRELRERDFTGYDDDLSSVSSTSDTGADASPAPSGH